MKNELRREIQRLSSPKSLDIKSIAAFRKSLALDTIDRIHTEQRRTAALAEKELMRILKFKF